MAPVTIRPERAEDHEAIAAVVTAAFPSPVEAGIVDAIRASDAFIPELSLVAETGGRIVGHVMISYAQLAGDGVSRAVALLGPLAVDVRFQGRGIGTALVREAAARADAMGEPLIVLEGSPNFYGRLGFEPSVRHGIEMPLPSWAPPEAARVLRAYDPSMRGRVVYPPAFDEATGET